MTRIFKKLFKKIEAFGSQNDTKPFQKQVLQA